MRRILVNVIVCAGLVLPALAEEGRIPVFEPIVIDAPGSYVVTSDILNDPAVTGLQNAIRIVGGGSVDLDLNGFTVENVASANSGTIQAFSVRRLRLHNGTVIYRGSNPTAMFIQATGEVDDEVVIEDLKVLHAGVVSTTRLALQSSSTSILNVRRNQFIGGGIQVDSEAGFIEGNTFRFAEVPPGGCAGILMLGSAKTSFIRSNSLDGSGCASIVVDNSTSVTVADNDLVGGEILVQSSTGCRVVNNNVSNGSLGGHGLRIESTTGCLVQENVVTGHRINGIQLFNAHRVLLRGNVSTDNGKFGIFINNTSSGITYGGNMSAGNAGAGCSNPGPATCGAPDFCDEGTNDSSFGDNLIPGPPPC